MSPRSVRIVAKTAALLLALISLGTIVTCAHHKAAAPAQEQPVATPVPAQTSEQPAIAHEPQAPPVPPTPTPTTATEPADEALGVTEPAFMPSSKSGFGGLHLRSEPEAPAPQTPPPSPKAP